MTTAHRQSRSQAHKELTLAIDRLKERERILLDAIKSSKVELGTVEMCRWDLEKQRDKLFEDTKRPRKERSSE